MKRRCIERLVALFIIVISSSVSSADEPVGDEPRPAPSPTARIVAALGESPLRPLVEEVLDRNPELARLEAAARAVDQRAPQAGAMPDPVASLTLFLQTPETRVGPQQGGVMLAQKLPWFGKLDLQEQAALYQSASAWARVNARRLGLTTKTRSLYHELAYLAAFERVVNEDRQTLSHFEELARARYAAGVGLEQSVVKLQAEITRDTTRLLDIATRKTVLTAAINALRDRPEGTSLVVDEIPDYGPLQLSTERLLPEALSNRPEMAANAAEIERQKASVELARKRYSPDVTIGLNYILVGHRDDPAGLANPPDDNGKDILGVTGGVNLPIWRKSLKAGVAEATELQLAAEAGQRDTVAQIRRQLDDLTSRIPLTWDRLDLFERVLIVQAEQSLRSAEAGYAAGTLGALDLLDAERVLLEVRIATERTRADYATAVAELEGAAGRPVSSLTGEGEER